MSDEIYKTGVYVASPEGDETIKQVEKALKEAYLEVKKLRESGAKLYEIDDQYAFFYTFSKKVAKKNNMDLDEDLMDEPGMFDPIE